ncbi:MAG: peroxiredoxin [Phycisphaeraceae bacterium]|nr:peroxiredoxin [Phycisphaeraceae bacterium]
MSANNDFPLPEGLPVPVDDGAADHLPGLEMPPLVLLSTDGSEVNLADIEGYWVLYIYPMTGRPGVALPDGWDVIPGARGCTPQSCGFRDHYAELQAFNSRVFGLSTQDSDYQREARNRLHLPFHLLSDSGLKLKHQLGLPTFQAAGMELFKRLTLIGNHRRIAKVFYPVFPPNQNAEDVLAWFKANT